MTVALFKLGLTVGIGVAVMMGNTLPTQAGTVRHEASDSRIAVPTEGAIAAHHEELTIVETAACVTAP